MENLKIIEKIYQPEPPLDEVFSHFYCLQTSPESETIIKHLSPNFEMILAFNFGKPTRISFGKELFKETVLGRVAIMGPLRQMLNYELLPETDAIIVNFRLNGFHRLFGLPVNELKSGLLREPDALMNKTVFSKLWDELSMLKDTDHRIRVIISSIAPFIRPNIDAVKPLLKGEHYFYDLAISPVKALAADAAITERTIQQHFQKQVGYSPKELLRFLRFKGMISQLVNQQDNNCNIFDLIVTHGYHDQSHLIKDFNHYLGTTPEKFIRTIKGDTFCIAGQDNENQH